MAIDPQRQQQPSSGTPMSVKDYFQLDYLFPDAKYEYQHGKIRLMAGGTGAHDEIAFNMRTALKQQFQSGPCSVKGSDMRVQIKADGTYFYPDVTVSCNVADRRRDTTLIESPHTVVEVLSASTAHTDRVDKLKAYKAHPTIYEIVLIDQYARHVEVYARDEDDTWSHVMYEEDEEVILPSHDICISMDEIYAGIDFNEPLIR